MSAVCKFPAEDGGEGDEGDGVEVRRMISSSIMILPSSAASAASAASATNRMTMSVLWGLFFFLFDVVRQVNRVGLKSCP